MNENIFKTRIRKLRQKLAGLCDVFIITSSCNVTYLTGFLGQDSWAVITPRLAYLITDSRYSEQADKEALGCKIIERKTGLADETARIIRRYKSVKTVGLEDSITINTAEDIRDKLNKKVKYLPQKVEELRHSKDDSEVKAVKKAAKIAENALKNVQKNFQKGISELELAGLLDLEIRRLGAVNSFPTIVAFGSNASRPHHQPGTRKLKKNDSILIDFGAVYKGYCSDITRCFPVGKAAPLFQKVYDVVLEANMAAISKLKPGVNPKSVEEAAKKVILDAGLPPYGHGTGHGLGLQVHEGPTVSSRAKQKLEPGNIITIEPGVYLPGKVGVRIEDDCLVTEDGCEVLTKNIHK